VKRFRRRPFRIDGRIAAPGTTQQFLLEISEAYTAQPVDIAVTVIRGSEPGPALFLTGAIHGDELNGVEIVRRVMLGLSPEKIRGTLVCVPVVNRFGFLNHSRYLPDRRDLNRCFPGGATGSSASRVAARVFGEIVRQCDFGIDFHTAARGRSNLPHVKASLAEPGVRRLAGAFGAEFILAVPGATKSLRTAATRAGVPVIAYEAGETSRFQHPEVRKGIYGVYNVLSDLGILPIPRREPRFQVIVKKGEWIRAERGGILDLAVRPGDLLYPGDRVGIIGNPFGREVVSLRSRLTGIVLGTTTIPMVVPGDAIVHVARLDRTLAVVERHARVDARGRPRIALDL
jgi:predicted deacylase